MRYLFGFMCVCALGVVPLVGCGETTGDGGSGGSAGAAGAGGAGGEGGTGGDPLTEAEAAAVGVLEAHMQARNERDADGLAATNNYPSVRLAGGDVKIWQTAEEFALWQVNVTYPFLDAEGWARSEWDAIDVIQSSANKVHLAVEFSRFDAEGTRYLTAESFWIVTKKGVHWGIQGRSSFTE
jgi:hypothetical protein